MSIPIPVQQPLSALIPQKRVIIHHPTHIVMRPPHNILIPDIRRPHPIIRHTVIRVRPIPPFFIVHHLAVSRILPVKHRPCLPHAVFLQTQTFLA